LQEIVASLLKAGADMVEGLRELLQFRGHTS
jgi:hypothetical protein